MCKHNSKLKTAIGATLILASPLSSVIGRAASNDVVVTSDRVGKLGTASTNNFDAGTTNGFFTPLGPNGRSCATCHVEENAWTFTPDYARAVARSNVADPLFAPVDGADCPATQASQLADARKSSMVLEYALIRETIAVPPGANFSVVSATNPLKCQIAPLSSGVSGKLVVYRRPLPTANLSFLSEVRWDGRETVQPIATSPGLTNIGPLLADLASQANHASISHEQSGVILGTQADGDIVTFEQNLYTSQIALGSVDLGTMTSPLYTGNTIAPQFFIGQNDPTSGNFSSMVFTLFTAWEPAQRGGAWGGKGA